ncbi:hypothetical protein OIO90_001891 [Microbotryomycetes sp. JL221]|nr:hypothetical protein OIO90_001891 [Microbotryomycetes sp. JL221]
MSTKLSPTLKTLVNSPKARGGPIPAPTNVLSVFERVKSSASKRGLGKHAWLTLSAATLVTLNSPDSLCRLYSFASQGATIEDQLDTAMLMREAGLKSISFSGIPRTINSLNALSSHFPPQIQSLLPTTPTRSLESTSTALSNTLDNSKHLWKDIYKPLDEKLLNKLGTSHPDLPIVILEANYGLLLSNPRKQDVKQMLGSSKEAPESTSTVQSRMTGRVLTSVIAIACLRAQGGVGPQVLSHVFGLKKAALSLEEEESIRQNTNETDDERVTKHERAFLTSDEGCEWVLNSVDDIVKLVAGERISFSGPTVDEPPKAKL